MISLDYQLAVNEMNLSEFPLVEFRIRSWILTVALVNSRIPSLEWCSCTNSILSHFFWAFKWYQIWANRGRIKEARPTYLVSCQEKTAPSLFSIGVNTVQSYYCLGIKINYIHLSVPLSTSLCFGFIICKCWPIKQNQTKT